MLLTWGSKIVNNNKIHKLQKKALRIVSNSDYVSHSEPICKAFSILKVTDIYRFNLWKFYFKLMNNSLPNYFNVLKPVLPNVCNYHEIRRPTFHLPNIKHEFAESMLQFQLVRLLNQERGAILITSKVHTHSFLGLILIDFSGLILNYTSKIK